MFVLQWEFQVGPAVGISAADQLWAARYILEVCFWSLKMLLSSIEFALLMHTLYFLSFLLNPVVYVSKNCVTGWWCFMQRITEIAGVVLSLDPKPIEVRDHLL